MTQPLPRTRPSVGVSTHAFDMNVPGFDDPVGFVCKVSPAGITEDGRQELQVDAVFDCTLGDCTLGDLPIIADDLFIRSLNPLPGREFCSVSQYISDHVLDMFWDRISEERE